MKLMLGAFVALSMFGAHCSNRKNVELTTLKQTPMQYCYVSEDYLVVYAHDSECPAKDDFELTVNGFAWLTGMEPQELAGYNVIFTSHELKCAGSYTDGCSDGSYAAIMTAPSQWRVLRHELGHQLLAVRGWPWENGDPSHRNLYYWDKLEPFKREQGW